MDEPASAIEAACSRLEVSHEQTARYLVESPFAAFAAGLHAGDVCHSGVAAPSYATAVCSLAATALEAGKQFVRDNEPESNRAAARNIYAALQRLLQTPDALRLLRSIGQGLATEFSEANAASVADVDLLRLMLRSTYRNVEILLLSLAKCYQARSE